MFANDQFPASSKSALTPSIDRIASESGPIEVFTLAAGVNPPPALVPLFQQYGRFRGNVYAKERHLIPLSALSAEGTEYDVDDPRSVHLIAVGRDFGADGLGDTDVRVYGSLRMIVRGAADQIEKMCRYSDAGLEGSTDLLPCESFYPEIWPEIDLRDSHMSCEYSRYIARHPVRDVNAEIAKALHRLAIQHIVNLGMPASFAVVEQSIHAHLVRSGLVLDQVSESRYLPEYSTVNHVVRIDAHEMAKRFGIVETPLRDLMAVQGLPVGLT